MRAGNPCKPILKDRRGAAFINRKHIGKILHVCKRLHKALPEQAILKQEYLMYNEMQVMQLSSHGGFVLLCEKKEQQSGKYY